MSKRTIAVSLDVWGTLIAPNPAFHESRNVALSNTLDVKLEVVERAFSKVHQAADLVQEQLGVCISNDALMNALIHEVSLIVKKPLFDVQQFASSVYATDVRVALYTQFFNYPPIINAQAIDRLLLDLKKLNVPVCITSNTSFIRGQWLQSWLESVLNVEAYQHVQFWSWSDQLGFGKPNPNMFSRAYVGLERDLVVHAGDNAVTDGACALYSKEFSFCQVSSPQTVHADVITHCLNLLEL